MNFKDIGFKEITGIESWAVLAGLVATLDAAAAANSVEDYRYALRCKKADVKIKSWKITASNTNKRVIDKAEYRVKLSMRGDLRTRILRPV